jgi:hypothetical protein
LGARKEQCQVELTGSLVEVREDSVHETVDRETDEIVGNINQELVPALGLVVLIMKAVRH